MQPRPHTSTKNTPCPIKRMTDQYFLGRVTIRSTNTNEPNAAVLKEHQRLSKVFSEGESQRLPQSTVWDHVIKLLPGAPNTLPGRLLPLTQEEKSKMHKLMQEHLKRGTICISKSPYAANFFFVKKKNRKLWPVQDYWPINKWTKKNRNVYPLIPQVIDASVDVPSSWLWTSAGDITTFKSKRAMKGKQHSSPMKDCLNQQSCSSA